MLWTVLENGRQIGEKLFAVLDTCTDNSKDNNFTANKLDDRNEWLNRHTDEYLRQLADMDEVEEEAQPGELTREELETRLKAAGERQERYWGKVI